MSFLLDPPVNGPDEDYQALFQSRHAPHRDFIERLWAVFEPYADPGFRIDIATQFQQRYWEMYLACAMIKHGITITSASHGPDIEFQHNGRTCWIEAKAPTAGQGQDAVPALQADGQAHFVPENQIVLRLTSAFLDKFEVYNKYLSTGRIGTADPFVIAIGSADIPHSDTDGDPPYINQALFPLGNPFVSFDRTTKEVVEEGYLHKPTVAKSKGTEVSTQYFMDAKYAGVSAVLYSRATIWTLEGFEVRRLSYLIHNPLAANPLPRGILPVAVEYWVEDGQLTPHNNSQ